MEDKKEYKEKVMRTIAHPRVQCPYCCGKQVRQQKTLNHFSMKTLRYFLCYQCAKTFKTEE